MYIYCANLCMREWTMTTVHHGDGGLVTHNRVTWYLRLGRTVTTKMTRHDAGFYPLRYFSQSTSTPFTPSAIVLNQKFSPLWGDACVDFHTHCTGGLENCSAFIYLLVSTRMKMILKMAMVTMTMMMLTTNKVTEMMMKFEFTFVAFSLASVYLVVLFSTWEGNFKTDEISTNPFKSIQINQNR